MRSRNGFTMVETLVAVVVCGLIVLVGFPKVSQGLARNDLRGARTTVVNAVAKARTLAAQRNTRAWLHFDGDVMWITAGPRTMAGAGTVDTAGGMQDLGELYKAGLAADVDSLGFDPRGFGSPATVVVSRAGYTETITVDALGRVTK